MAGPIFLFLDITLRPAPKKENFILLGGKGLMGGKSWAHPNVNKKKFSQNQT